MKLWLQIKNKPFGTAESDVILAELQNAHLRALHKSTCGAVFFRKNNDGERRLNF
jgi:hypothetical protein